MKRRIIYGALGVALVAGLLALPQAALAGVGDSLSLFTGTLLPSLFPFLVASQLLEASGLLAGLGRALERVMPRLFGLPGGAALALALSLAAGYPAGARTVGQLAVQGVLTEKQARWASCLASHAGPAFILGAVGTVLLGDRRLGLLLWGCHLAASLLLGALLKPRLSGKSLVPPREASSARPWAELLSGALRALAVVGGNVLLFGTLLALARACGLLPLLAQGVGALLAPLGFSRGLALPLLEGMVELSAGCRALASSGAPLDQVVTGIAFLLGFGGLCVQAQSLSLAPDLRPGPFLAYKTTQALASAGLTRAVYLVLGLTRAVYLPQVVPLPVLSARQLLLLATVSLGMFLAFLAACGLILAVVKD